MVNRKVNVRTRRKWRKKIMDRKKTCRFCAKKIKLVDYKEIAVLSKLFTSHGKLYSAKRSGNCSKHQRQVKIAVKRARFLALAPFIGA
ncbi:MAG: 30S ribosomal protein S18 [Planctomycetota bacterium]|jgi:small subunit ribosomal protein S18